jgi:enterochelin esterase-like enzyme
VKGGTPLVEPAPADDRYSLVTFLWRGNRDTRGVFVLGSIARDAPMARLEGTDVWYRSYLVRKDARFTYRLAPVRQALDPDKPADRSKIRETAQIDPLNPRRHPPAGPPLLSLAELPDAPVQPWLARRPETPAGTVKEETIRSSILKGNRPVAVYTPPGYGTGEQIPSLLIVLDGSAYRDLIPLPVILDNLLEGGQVPPALAVLVGRLEASERESDLSCNASFTRFLAEELLPWVRTRYRVAPDAGRVVLAGSSLGGLAATCAALERPDLFGNVLAQSGSFTWRPEGDSQFEWVSRQIPSRPRLPLRFYLDIGLMETWPVEGNGPSLLDANRRLRQALKTKGYEVHEAEYSGGHGYANWQATLPEGLVFLLKK